MWLKNLIALILFYFFAVLQNSFFVHFTLLRVTPNLVFILFFLLVFFEGKKLSPTIIFYSVSAGFFLDIFSYTRLGISLFLLVALGLFIKIAQSFLKQGKDEYPYIYFLPLFLAGLVAYELLVMFYLKIFDPAHIAMIINWRFLIDIAYNAVLASVIFWVYKKITGAYFDNRQLQLFKK